MSNLSGTLGGSGWLSGKLQGSGTLTGKLGSQSKEIPYPGPYEVKPSLESDITLYTKTRTCKDDIIVKQVPMDEVPTPDGGFVLFIGGE